MELFDNQTKKKVSFDVDWIKNEKGLPKKAVRYAELFGEYLADPQRNGRAGFNALTTSQLRNFFGEIRRIQMKGYEQHQTEFIMLKPKLAYATARVLQSSWKNRIKDFKEVLSSAINSVEQKEDFENFVNFVEATVAYHKAYGGK